MSLYREYIYEHRGDKMVERPEGFASYRYLDFEGRKAVYIVDIYVDPKYRKLNIAAEMADEVAKDARREQCKVMLGTVVPSANASTVSLRVLLAYGMTLASASNDLIIMKKEI